MAGFTMSEVIERPQEEVFDVLAHPDQVSIMENIKSTEKISDGPVGVGTRYRETRLINGKEEVSELEVVQYEPHRQFSIASQVQGIRVVYEYTLQPQDGSTRIDWTCEVQASGLKKAMLPVVAGIMKKEDGDHLQKLKRALESSPA